MYKKIIDDNPLKNYCESSENSDLYRRASSIKLSILRRESNPMPISSLKNESSVFYNPEHTKVFSKRFNLKGKKWV